MSEYKYILFEVPVADGLKRFHPIIFPVALCHDLMAEAVLSNEKEFAGAKAVSAGFIRMDADVAYGKSVTLKMAANPDRDTHILRFNSYGVDLLFDS